MSSGTVNMPDSNLMADLAQNLLTQQMNQIMSQAMIGKKWRKRAGFVCRCPDYFNKPNNKKVVVASRCESTYVRVERDVKKTDSSC